MKIRAATPGDAHAIASIQVRAWRAAYRGIVSAQLLDEMSVELRETTWRGVVTEGSGPTLVATDSGGHEPLAGFCSLWLPSHDDDAGERTAEVAAAYVDPARWQSGVGRALHEQALGSLEPGHWDAVTLWVFKRNAQARAFYARLGFRLEGAESTHKASGVDTVRMRLALD